MVWVREGVGQEVPEDLRAALDVRDLGKNAWSDSYDDGDDGDCSDSSNDIMAPSFSLRTNKSASFVCKWMIKLMASNKHA